MFKQFKELEPLVRDYLTRNPNSWWGHYVLGYTLFGLRRIGDSIGALAKSLQLNLDIHIVSYTLFQRSLLIGMGFGQVGQIAAPLACPAQVDIARDPEEPLNAPLLIA